MTTGQIAEALGVGTNNLWGKKKRYLNPNKIIQVGKLYYAKSYETNLPNLQGSNRE